MCCLCDLVDECHHSVFVYLLKKTFHTLVPTFLTLFHRHTVIECIPLPKTLARDAPLYFQKAIMEADEEWSTNKKLIDTRKKGFRRTVPKDFPYFCVEFGEDGGFAHTIEDREQWPENFGKEILCGMLQLPAPIVMRQKRENHGKEVARARKFLGTLCKIPFSCFCYIHCWFNFVFSCSSFIQFYVSMYLFYVNLHWISVFFFFIFYIIYICLYTSFRPLPSHCCLCMYLPHHSHVETF